ncbi:TetR/AcrR family transcriptional regulator, partial [Klebsiella pneumoniae]|nr:TetR/AcrR family transcriptional regulator [Klebsiella pneumoniae]
ILTSALDLLSGDATRQPTTALLARHAHVSIGTVYRYFADMDAIVEELRLAAVHDITASLASGIGRAMDAEPMTAMVTVVETLTSAFEKH